MVGPKICLFEISWGHSSVGEPSAYKKSVLRSSPLLRVVGVLFQKFVYLKYRGVIAQLARAQRWQR